MGRSSGACSTIVVEPEMHRMHPSTPARPNRSFSIKCASTALQHRGRILSMQDEQTNRHPAAYVH